MFITARCRYLQLEKPKYGIIDSKDTLEPLGRTKTYLKNLGGDIITSKQNLQCHLLKHLIMEDKYSCSKQRRGGRKTFSRDGNNHESRIPLIPPHNCLQSQQTPTGKESRTLTMYAIASLTSENPG